MNVTDAAKALVRASYTDGRYTGPSDIAEPIQALGHWLRAGAPVGELTREETAEVLASGAPTLVLQVQPIGMGAVVAPDFDASDAVPVGDKTGLVIGIDQSDIGSVDSSFVENVTSARVKTGS
jgi:hypothetical protein